MTDVRIKKVEFGKYQIWNDDTYYTLKNVHNPENCEGRACVIHHPTDHHMSDWILYWRDDRGIFERLCPEHGTGHPDPDQGDFWRETNQEWQWVHGCCGAPGCCSNV